uniref:Si:dkey-16l2.20 n=1 Tax=Paramormyrops kingsleyae TaxID=1676925 RepID=A0A3B3TES7_9TELE
MSDGPVMGEAIPLQTVPIQKSEGKRPSRRIKLYRKLAVCSIICGISCLGILALINSVRVSVAYTRLEFSRQARKYSVIAIVVWVGILVLTPVMMALVSYLLRIAE